VLRGEVQQTQITYQQAQFGLQQTQVQLDLKKVAAVNVCDRLSFIQNGEARADFSLRCAETTFTICSNNLFFWPAPDASIQVHQIPNPP
jgi:hypothetical protein